MKKWAHCVDENGRRYIGKSDEYLNWEENEKKKKERKEKNEYWLNKWIKKKRQRKQESEMIDNKSEKRGKWETYTDNELLSFIKNYYDENKKVPSVRDFKIVNKEYPNHGTYYLRFGSWNNAIKLAGLDSNRIVDYTDSELLESLRKFYMENNRVPLNTDFIGNQKYPSRSIVTKRFGSWNEALRKAGLDVNEEHHSYHIMSDDELLDCLNEYYSKNNKVPIATDFNNTIDYPSFMTYLNRFGSWNNALKMAGLEVNREFYSIYTDEELLDFLVNYFERTENVPTEKAFKENSECPSVYIYRRRFGSWLKALELVELDYDSAVDKGILQHSSHKGRLFERYVRDSFKNESKDLSGDNCRSPFDGICPKGKSYDAKSSSLQENGNWKGWYYYFKNKMFSSIEYFYIGAFNKDYSKLLYVWLLHNSFIRKRSLNIGIYGGEYNLNNMKEYEVTDKCNFSIFK